MLLYASRCSYCITSLPHAWEEQGRCIAGRAISRPAGLPRGDHGVLGACAVRFSNVCRWCCGWSRDCCSTENHSKPTMTPSFPTPSFPCLHWSIEWSRHVRSWRHCHPQLFCRRSRPHPGRASAWLLRVPPARHCADKQHGISVCMCFVKTYSTRGLGGNVKVCEPALPLAGRGNRHHSRSRAKRPRPWRKEEGGGATSIACQRRPSSLPLHSPFNNSRHISQGKGDYTNTNTATTADHTTDFDPHRPLSAPHTTPNRNSKVKRRTLSTA